MYPRCARAVLAVSAATLFATFGDAGLSGQSSLARPNIAVTRVPSMPYRPTPGDFNNDGRTDLVAGRPVGVQNNTEVGGELVVRLGNGDGTFGEERVIATPVGAFPLGVGDFNADGAADVVAFKHLRRTFEQDETYDVWILPGNGDGSFRPAVRVDAFVPLRKFFRPSASAIIADLDRDGHLDLAVTAAPDELRIYPGNGDFTFDPHATLTTAASPEGAVASDLNGDGLRDIVVATRVGRQVDVFINRGGFAFGAASIPLDRAALDVTVADLNRDGRGDLIVAAGTEGGNFEWSFSDGRVLVMLGNGNGTFGAPGSYDVPPAPIAIVAGDFNRDGMLDVATANRTDALQQEECGPKWGTISLLPGTGAGGLGAPASFQPLYVVAELNRNPHAEWLATARLDGDAHTDLVTSGALLPNIPDAFNRAPRADAGPDRTIDDTSGLIVLQAQADDPDNDRLTYRWLDEDGRTIATCQQPDIFSPERGEHTYTLIVRDDRGGTATDNVTVTDVRRRGVGLEIVRPSFDNPVPAFAPYVIQFRVVNPDGEQITDFDISVDRNGQNNFTPIPACTNLPSSATECVWQDPGPPSADAALLFRIATPDGRSAGTVARFQIVATPPGGMPSGWANADVGAVGAAGAAGFDGHAFTVRGSGADIWGTADEFHWAFTTVTGNFEMTARVANVQNINAWTKAGLMVRETQAPGSRHASVFATPGTSKPISFQRRPTANGPSVHTGGAIAAPPAWLMLRRTGDIVAAFYRTSAEGDWTPLGTQTLTGLPSSVHLGLAMSSHVDGTLATATFDNVKIDQGAEGMDVLRPLAGEQVQTNAPFVIRWMPSSDGTDIARYDVFFAPHQNGPWSNINECRAVPGDRLWCVWQRPRPVGPGHVRVVATTHTGSVRDVISHAFQIVVSGGGEDGMPAGWTCGDAGAVGAAGSCGFEVDDELIPNFNISGSGADIWGTADEFGFARYAAYGDFTFTARVLAVQNVNRWTKAGIMIRDWNGVGTPPAGSRHASFFVTPTTEKGTAFQRRPEDGGASVHTAGPVATAPMWVKLVRTGDTIRAYSRVNAADAWTFVGEQTFRGLPYQVSAMLVVSSHVDGTVARAAFEDVSVVDRLTMQSADIGGAIPGRTFVSGVETTIQGDGADIWNTADSFRFHYTKWRGNGYVVARVRSLQDTNAWAKAGVMFRQSLDPGSPHVMAIVSPGKGLAMQSRSARGGTSASTAPMPGKAPVWIVIRRFVDTFSASWSADGETWHFLGEIEMPMGEELLVGLPVTSHASGTVTTAVFDDVLIWHSLRF